MESAHTFETTVSMEELAELRSDAIEQRFALVSGAIDDPDDQQGEAFAHAFHAR